jgi:predicted TPR repeat methyltransferase
MKLQNILRRNFKRFMSSVNKEDIHQLFKSGSDYSKFRPGKEISNFKRLDYPKELYEKIKDYSKIKKNSLTLDIACGTGEATKDLLSLSNKVIGIDVSKEQLASAFQHENIQYFVRKSEETGLENESIDLITVAQVLILF